MFNGHYSAANTLFTNNGLGDFTDMDQLLQGPDDPSYTWDSIFLDVNNDSYLDIVEAAANGATTRVWLNDGLGNFVDSGQALLPGTNVRKVDS